MATRRQQQQQQAADTHPEVVNRAANLAGARQGKDAVPAGIDYTQAINALADKELGISVKAYELANSRVGVWLEVAKLGQGKPEVFSQYAAAFRLKSRIGMGLTVEQAAGKPKEWAPHIQLLWNSHVGKRVAETSRVMLALEKSYTDSIRVLEAPKLGVNEKLATLPATRARPQREPAGSTDQTKKGGKSGPTVQPNQEVAANAAKKGVDIDKRVKALDQSAAEVVKTFAGDMDTQDIPGALFAIIATAKRHKEFNVKTGNRFTILIQKCEAAYLEWEQADAAASANVKQHVVV